MKQAAYIDSKNRVLITDYNNDGLVNVVVASAKYTPRGWYWHSNIEARSARKGVATLQLALAAAAKVHGMRLVDAKRDD